MDGSLSVVLPVRNAEKLLEKQVNELIDVVVELTDDVEILIVDDGSTDGTVEVAAELHRCYPQVDLVSYSAPLGFDGAAQIGIGRATGREILIHDIQTPLRQDAIGNEVATAESENVGRVTERVTTGKRLLRSRKINDFKSDIASTAIGGFTRTDSGTTLHPRHLFETANNAASTSADS